MAAFTKGQIRAAVQQAIDDPNAKRWTNASLDSLITMVEDTMFQTILDTFEGLLSQSDTSAAAAGVIALSSLTKRLFRIQKVTSGGVELQPRLFTEQVPQASYYLLGANLITDPSVGSANVTTTYSYLPASFQSLANDATVLPDYPEGHEAALVYLSSAWALAKGDAEDMTQAAKIADNAVESMLLSIARRYPVGVSNKVAEIKSKIMRNTLVGITGQ